MTLEDLIYNRLTVREKVQENLTTYGNSPAVFLQRAPDDTASEWGAAKYPRAEYLVDMTADPERHSSGVVTVHIYSDETGVQPEEIAPEVRAALCDVVMQADDGAYCVTWDRTELFDMQASQNPDTLVNGCTITFLLIAFPAQQSKDPDPAIAVQDWLSCLEPLALVINKNRIESVYEPSEEYPAFYVRVSGYKTGKQTYALTWLDAVIAIHVIAPTPEARNSWARYIADSLNIAGEVTLMDGSPMLVREVAVDNAADYLTRGQISIRAQFAVTNFREYAHPLKKAYSKMEEEKMTTTKKAAEIENSVNTDEAVKSSAKAVRTGIAGESKIVKPEDGSVYTTAELAKASCIAFDRPYSPDIVRAAMKMAGKTTATRTEAADIIRKFLGKDKEVSKV